MLRKGILPPFQTLNNELILYQALKFGDSNVKLGNKIVNDLLRTWHWHVNMKPKQISMFSRNGFSLWPWHDIDMSIWSRSRFPCLPKTDSHFGQSETWIRARSDRQFAQGGWRYKCAELPKQISMFAQNRFSLRPWHEAEADFHVCPKRFLTSARAKLESKQDQIGSLLRKGGDTSVPNCRSRFPCLPKTDSHFGHDMTLTCQYEAEADFHVCPKRFLH